MHSETIAPRVPGGSNRGAIEHVCPKAGERSALVPLPVRRAQRDCPNGSRAQGGGREHLPFNTRAKSLRFPAFPPKHCSIDLRFFRARPARHQESSIARVTVELQSRTPKAYFSSLFAPGLQPRRETLSSQEKKWWPEPLRRLVLKRTPLASRSPRVSFTTTQTPPTYRGGIWKEPGQTRSPRGCTPRTARSRIAASHCAGG